MQAKPWPDVPELTGRVARMSNPKPGLAMLIRDELGEVWADQRFAAAFGVRGRPGISPGQLMMVTVLQFAEDLTDRQAAAAVRERITWKYALGLELEDPGFDPTVLSEFRARLVDGGLADLALQALLERLMASGLLKAGGRARTDSTHVMGAIRLMNRLELAGESVRAVLEALAAAAPSWLGTIIDERWQQVYRARIDDMHLPESKTARQELMLAYARDGYHLLDQIYSPTAPVWVRELDSVSALRQIWVQQFYRQIDPATRPGSLGGHREVVRVREKSPDGEGVPPGRVKLISPYDLDARYSIKRDTRWGGYKVHFTETCNPAAGAQTEPGRGDTPNLITNVLTTVATDTDVEMIPLIHEQLAGRALLPDEHLVDSGYAAAEAIVAATTQWGITLITPLQLDRSAQARAGNGYDKASFVFDFDTQTGTCPQNKTSATWTTGTKSGREIVLVTWATSSCAPCPVRTFCTRTTRRNITLHPRALHEILTHARTQQETPEWKTRYATRAGVEGTMRQTTHVTGIRRARYQGLPKTRLEHTLAATAINLIRMDAYWNGHPLDRTRTTHLTRLDLTLSA
jgi:transposase